MIVDSIFWITHYGFLNLWNSQHHNAKYVIKIWFCHYHMFYFARKFKQKSYLIQPFIQMTTKLRNNISIECKNNTIPKHGN
jgi:hypothetical protein